MSDLPVERLTVTPPFTYVGLNLFGPFIVEEGRRELKRYGGIFTCLSYREVHLVVVNSMDTDCFIQSLTRFIVSRGNVRLTKCHNGANFAGGKNELNYAFTMMDDKKIKFFLANLGTNWVTFSNNSLAASYMGEVWERHTGSCRNILSSILNDHGTSLNDELL